MSHLQFYKEHGISPVNYDLTDFEAHLDRRDSLYRSLGVPRIVFKNADILEVAAGTGQNSLYVAGLSPLSITLLEPNPVAIEKIISAYKEFDDNVCTPTIIEDLLEDYDPQKTFDVVICENWLGASDHERRLLIKLGTLVASSGLLIITTVTPVGLISNLIRRALSVKLSNPKDKFETRTKLLSDAFDTHLKTITSMTRNTVDWVQDNMINPAYFKLSLTVPMVVEDIGSTFEIIESNPKFRQDWRWFKTMYGENKQFNEQYLTAYKNINHNFIDYRFDQSNELFASNSDLEKEAIKLNENVSNYEHRVMEGEDHKLVPEELLQNIEKIASMCATMPTPIMQSLQEVSASLVEKIITAEDISHMMHFKNMFGRETLYLSMQKKA